MISYSVPIGIHGLLFTFLVYEACLPTPALLSMMVHFIIPPLQLEQLQERENQQTDGLSGNTKIKTATLSNLVH